MAVRSLGRLARRLRRLGLGLGLSRCGLAVGRAFGGGGAPIAGALLALERPLRLGRALGADGVATGGEVLVLNVAARAHFFVVGGSPFRTGGDGLVAFGDPVLACGGPALRACGDPLVPCGGKVIARRLAFEDRKSVV